MLYSIMDRQDDIVRVGKEWGMAAWYPSMKGKGKRGKGGAEKIEGQKGDDDKEDEHAAA
jgi:hypothetical protein